MMKGRLGPGPGAGDKAHYDLEVSGGVISSTKRPANETLRFACHSRTCNHCVHGSQHDPLTPSMPALCVLQNFVRVCVTTGAARRERRKQEKERREQQRREEASRKGPKYKNLTPDDVKELANNKDYSWLRAAAGPSKCVHTGVIGEPVWLTLCACLYGAAGE